jgi:hypothetical protein
MNARRILQLNAAATAACAVGMLAGRGILPSLFGLDSSLLLDSIAVALLAYAGALAFAAERGQVSRATMMFFTVADAVWVVGSAVVLVAFWTELAALARVLVIAVAVVVEAFALLQFREAGAIGRRQQQLA